MSKTNIKKILVIKTHAIGDVLMATPAFRALRDAYPQADISVLVGKWSAPVLRDNPYITRCIEFDDAIVHKRRLFKLARLILNLRTLKYDTAVILHPSPFIHLIAVLAGIKNRAGLCRRGKNLFLTSSVEENGSYDYYYPMNFLNVINVLTASVGKTSADTAIQVFSSDQSATAVKTFLKNKGVVDCNKLILIAPGGSSNPKEHITARIWPWEKYVGLIRTIVNRTSDYTIILSGGIKDKAITTKIKKTIPNVIDVAGETTIDALIALVGLSQCVICNDSAILHISIAQHRPTIGIFGPTSIKSRVPPSQRENCIESSEACSPCYHYGKFPGCKKNVSCMEKILPEMVFEKVRKVLDKRKPE